MPSDIEICNIALSYVGKDEIRTFAKSNKAERVCERAYNHCLRRLLSGRYSWSFAREVASLRVTVGKDVNSYGTPYDKPIDCLVPRDILPEGTKQSWELIGDSIYTRVYSPQLLYTKKIERTSLMPEYFISALTMLIASMITPSMKGGTKIEGITEKRALAEVLEAMDADASIGTIYKRNDNDPNQDSFVNPDAAMSDYIAPTSETSDWWEL